MLTEYFRQEPRKKEEIVWDQPVLLRPQKDSAADTICGTKRSSTEEISPLSVRSEQDFAPTGKPQRNPQTTEKEAFSEMPRKGFRIGKRAWLIREMLSVRIKRPVIRRKGKSTGSTCLYQSSSPFAAPVATVSGEKSIRRKSPIRKNTDSFFVFIVYTCRILLQ